MLDEMHGFLMVVSAEHEVNTDLRERAEDLARVLESVSARELSLHRVVMHDNDARGVRWRALELLARAIDLRPADRADDGDVANTPRERVPSHAVRRVESNERGAGHAQHGLEVCGDILAIALVDATLVPDTEWRLPPNDVVVARDDNRLADAIRIADECLRALELPGLRALRKITRDTATTSKRFS